jgi:hypothetical protein
MTELNTTIKDIPLPARLARRPVNDRGFPVPWFVSFRDGDWDFVNLDPEKIAIAYRQQTCWLCGEKLGQFKSFVIGPMCSINRVTSEPAQHKDCSEYAVRSCPFLVRPNTKRNTKATMAPGNIPGIHLDHNPGASLIWTTKSYKPIRVDHGVLFELGDPVDVSWWAHGRKATRAEIDAAIAKGIPRLRQAAAMQGRGSIAELERYLARAEKLLPVE